MKWRSLDGLPGQMTAVICFSYTGQLKLARVINSLKNGPKGHFINAFSPFVHIISKDYGNILFSVKLTKYS